MSNQIEIVRGDTFTFATSLTDSAGAAQSLSGYTIEWVIARTPASEPTLEKAIGSGVTVTDSDGGEFTLELTAAETAALAVGTWFHRVTVIDGSAKKTTIINEYISILPTVM